MKPSLRASTTAKSNQLKEKLEQRELKSAQRKSRSLVRFADNNQVSVNESIQLSTLNNSFESSEFEFENLPISSSQGHALASQVDGFWFDTSNLELTNLVRSPPTPAPASSKDPELWSSVNQFYPEGCVVSPLVNPEVSGALSTVNLSDSEAPILPALSIIMDSKNIASKVKGLENFAAGIDMLIERFNPETVTVLDKDDYKAELSSIFSKLTEMQGKVNTLTESLDESQEEHRNAIGKVTALFNNA